MIQPVIAITHAAFDEHRRMALQRLLSQLRVEAPLIPTIIARDETRMGSWRCWERAMSLALLDPDVTHICWLPDDAIVCRDFGKVLMALIEARPDDVFDQYVNHQLGATSNAQWYCSVDGGFTGMGGVFPRGLLDAHLRWLDGAGLYGGQYSNDGGINLWAMSVGRKLYKTTRTFVQHDDSLPSIDGNDAHDYRQGLRWADDERAGILEDTGNFLGRTYAAPHEHLPGARTSCTMVPRTYVSNHWDMVRKLPSTHWNLDEMYRIERNGVPVNPDAPSVCIATPTYRELHSVVKTTEKSRRAMMEDLVEHRIGVQELSIRDDALVCRMRQRVVHAFLRTECTHLLFLDADIELLDPSCIREMLMRDKGVIAGACPFKNTSGKVVCNLRPEDIESGHLEVVGGCLPVQDAGTGCMLISRDALYRLMEAHPELMHESRNEQEYGAPLWALFNSVVHDRTLLSEDYYFCRLWQELGEQVYVYVPAKFRHWGLHAFEGSLEQQWGLKP